MSLWKRAKAEAERAETHANFLNRDPAQLHRELLHELDPHSQDYAARVTERLLQLAECQSASDLHLDAVASGYIVRLRVDGRLREIGMVPQSGQTSIAGRIKALAGLLTYRSDIPQEGRLTTEATRREARVVTLPTLHGERIVVRLVDAVRRQWQLADLGLNPQQRLAHENALSEQAGVLLFTGPVGAGKTTTAYASLRSLATAIITEGKVARPARCVVTLEDPIESEIVGVAQSQIDPNVGFDWSVGLKSLLRQDPEVVFIGEIRDAQTAQLAFRASMAGQLVLSTMHARSVCEGLLRLLDMHVPSQHLLSGLRLLTCQRLVCQPCDCGSGCQACDFTLVRGRHLTVEILPELRDQLARTVAAEDSDLAALQAAACAQGLVPIA